MVLETFCCRNVQGRSSEGAELISLRNARWNSSCSSDWCRREETSLASEGQD